MEIQQIISRESEETMNKLRQRLPRRPSKLTEEKNSNEDAAAFSAQSAKKKSVQEDKTNGKFFYPVLRTGHSLPSPYFFRRNILIEDPLSDDGPILPWAKIKKLGIK